MFVYFLSVRYLYLHYHSLCTSRLGVYCISSHLRVALYGQKYIRYVMRVPISATAALKQLSPRRAAGKNLFFNRFDSLRSNSPSLADKVRDRSRSQSTKRKTPEVVSYAQMVGSNAASQLITSPNLIEEATVRITKVKSLCEKIVTDISESCMDPALIAVFGSICEAIKLTSQTQEDIILAGKSNFSTRISQQSSMTSLGAIPKKPRQDPTATFDSGRSTHTVPEDELSEEDQVNKKFAEAVREAEKSTLVFNLNMGTVPIMNKDTMATKATLALTTMAATVEGKTSSFPSDDSVAAIDDVLSMSTDMSFFGNATKSYKNPKDEKNGSFCTIPVKYSFKDKDTRIRAETVLRERCKVNCSTPYPIILRETIRQVTTEFRNRYSDNFIRVTVDTKNMGLRVARRPPKESGDSTWQVYAHLIPIPLEALDVSSRTVPKDFRVTIPIRSPIPPNSNMDTNGSSPRNSRRDLFDAAGGGSPK